MIHWILFNLIVATVSLALIFDIRNSTTIIIAWILLIVAFLLIIKDSFAMSR